VLDSLVEAGAVRLRLGPLAQTAVEQVIGDALGAAPGPRLRTMAEEAGGIPYDLDELLLGLREEDMLRIEGGRAEATSARLPRRIGEGMRSRLARLSESARRVAIVAGSLGPTFSLGELAKMLDESPSALLVAVDQLTRADILREADEAIGFRHDLTREAVRAAVPASTRRALDRQAVDVLLEARTPTAEVAAQLAASAAPGDEAAIELLYRVSETLAETDPESAAALAGRALDLAGEDHPLRGPLVARTAHLLNAGGQIGEATAFLDRELREVLPVEEESAVCLGIAGMFGVSPDVRASIGRRALALPGLTAADRVRHQTRLAYNLVQAGRAQAARAELTKARNAAAEAPEEDAAHSMLLLAEGAIHYVDGEFERALELHEQAMRGPIAVGEPMRRWVVRQWRAELQATLGRLPEASALVDEGIASATRGHQAWAVDFFETWRGRQLLQSGRPSDAVATLEDRFEPLDDTRVTGSLYAAGLVALGRAAIHTGDRKVARRTATLAREMLEKGTPSTRRHAAWLLSLQASAEGRPESALELLREIEVATSGAILPLFPMDITDEPHLVRMMLAGGEGASAETVAGQAAARAERNPALVGAAATSAHCRGLILGRPEPLAEAVDLLRAEGRPLTLASASEDLGRLLMQEGEREKGLATLGRSLEIYARTGAGWDAARVRARLRAGGVKRRLLPVERPSQGWEALTDSEAAVARLIAEGMTNREAASRLFVSPHTVNSHLRKVFLKLGVNSRSSLVRSVSERDGRASDEPR
jgi:DNA-binding CsgD family transcriptional regulator